MPFKPDDTLAKQNALILAMAAAFGSANPSIVIALGGLVGQTLAEDKALATLPVSVTQLGLALGTIPAAMLMRRAGRRTGYIVGAIVGVIAGCVAAYGIAAGSFWLFCLGTFISGFYGSYVQSYRFAATDSASDKFKAAAISWVMIGGLAAAIIGPQTVIWTKDALPNVPFAGGFIGQAALALVSIAILAFLRPTPVSDAPKAGGRPLSEIVRQPRFVTAVAAGLVSYGLMSFVMTATPVAMVGCGHSVETATLGIQWHIIAMFGPSFFTGRLIERFGKEQVTVAGLILIAASAVVGLSGLSVGHFWITLVLLGIGWNFGFIGATSLVTDCYRPEERAKVQAANDFLVFGSVAVASFSSGKLLHVGGWETVNWLVFPPVALALVLLLLQVRSKPAVA
jgi:MFS family permease